MRAKLLKSFDSFFKAKSWYLLALLTVIAMVLSPGLKNIKISIGPELWFKPNAPILNELKEFNKTFGSDESLVIAVHNKEGVLNPKTIEQVKALTENLWNVQDVIRVESLANYNWIHSIEDEIISEALFSEDVVTPDQIEKRLKLAGEIPEIQNRLISKDKKTAIIIAHLKPYYEGYPDHVTIYKQVEDVIAKNTISDDKILISGSVAVAAVSRKVSDGDFLLFAPIFLGLVIFLLGFYFKSLYGIVYPLAVILYTLIINYSIMGLIGVKFNLITFITPLTLMAIAIADSVHFISEYKRSLLKFDKETSSKKSFLKNFYPTLITSLTTGAGFLSLATVDLVPVKNLGIICSLGTVLAWVCSVILYYPLLKIAPKKATGSFQLKKETVRKLVYFITSNKNPIMVIFSIFSIYAFVHSFQNEVNFNFFKNLKEDVSVSKANTFLLKNFGGLAGPEVVIHSGSENGIKDPNFLKKVENFENWIKEDSDVTSVSSIVEVVRKVHSLLNNDDPKFKTIPENKSTVAEILLLHTMSLPPNANINHLLDVKHSKLRMTVYWKHQSAQDSRIGVKKIKAKAKELGLNISVTGNIQLYQEVNNSIVDALFTSIGTAIFFITLLIIFIVKSLKIGLFSLIPNLIPLFIGGAFLRYIGHYVDSGVVVVFSVCLGIAVDDTIHFLTSFQENQKKNLSLFDSFVEVFHSTGNALFITSAILFVGFGLFSFSDYMINARFGMLASIIIVSALILDLIFLPTLIMFSNKIFKPKKNYEFDVQKA